MTARGDDSAPGVSAGLGVMSARGDERLIRRRLRRRADRDSFCVVGDLFDLPPGDFRRRLQWGGCLFCGGLSAHRIFQFGCGHRLERRSRFA